MRIRSILFGLPLAAICMPGTAGAQASNPKIEEVTFIKDIRRVPDRDRQAELRRWAGWPAFRSRHPRWSAEFNEASGLPRKAYGDPISIAGASIEERSLNFFSEELAPYQLPLNELELVSSVTGKKNTFAHFSQKHQGLTVLGASAMVKFDHQNRVISFSADLVKQVAVSTVPTISPSQAFEQAQSGLSGVEQVEYSGTALLALEESGRQVVKLVHRIMVHTRQGDTPGHHHCLVDAHAGTLLYRVNDVRSCGHGTGEGEHADAGIDVSVTALAYTGSPLVAPQVQPLPNLNITIDGSIYRTDVAGYLASGVPGPSTGIVQLRGRWAAVSTNTVTPQFTANLNEGFNEVTFNNNANIRERSAYIYVDQIHGHMKSVLPDFTGMDLQLPTRLDLTSDNCNAFYDGSSINFYAEGNNCRSLATINDVVYHEYGHGINDRFYLSLGSNFINGAMNEGYADIWALTLTQSPILGLGMRLDDPNSTVRRYDQDPKVYPDHIVGEVHADGEIIAGAWWDLYELLGNDMSLTLELFAEAYPGLQANTFNGNEGQAYRDVLLDVLQADDTDGDITNGTTNGAAIVEAFGRHGITLISDAELFHDGRMSAPADEPIDLDAVVFITFPSTLYLDQATMFYKVNDQADWTSVPMTNAGEGAYLASIPPQSNGTVVSYYLALSDIFGQTSSITPIASDRNDPGLPFYILVGYDLAATENADNLSELGPWQEGQPGDNASTGQWEFGPPIPSYGTFGDLSTICQTGTQHTPGGDYCWYTGNALSASSPLGDNDVDEGSTTLLGPNIDLAPYVNPAMSYWRWYTNNPPSGANPNTDWWQVYASGDNGSTWVPVEDTKTGERNWRRKAFRVADVLGENATQIRLKFIASDSIRPEQELEGGSLVEAAIDDIELWSAQAPDAISEHLGNHALKVWPVPAKDQVFVEISTEPLLALFMEVLDITGRVVVQPRSIRAGTFPVDVSNLADGQYVLRLRSSQGSTERRFSILH